MKGRIAASAGAILLCAAWQSLPVHAQTLPACSSHDLTRPVPANSHAPTDGSYPLISTALGEEGTTILQFDVEIDGTVKNPTIAKSSSSLRLDDASVMLTKGWLYKPALSNGRPVACRNTAGVMWRMHDGTSPDSPARVVHMDRRDYPAGALAKGEQGTTVIMTMVSAKGGKIQSIFRSSGYPDLDDAALAIAAGKVKLSPGTYDGEPSPTAMVVAMIWSTADPVPK